MSLNGDLRAELRRERREALLFEAAHLQAAVELKACLTAMEAIQDPAAQPLASAGLASVRQELDEATEQIVWAPRSALKAIRKAKKQLHRIIAETQATAHQWSQQRAQSEARIAEVCQRAETTRQTVNSAGRELLQQADERLTEARVLHKGGRYADAGSMCDQALACLQHAAKATFNETVRREVVRGLVVTLTDMGFVMDGPQLIKDQADAGIVTLVGQLPSGRQARFDVHLDGRMVFDFDGYTGRACGKDLEQIERSLQERFGVQLGPRQVTWKNPDRISKGARDLPSGGQQRAAH